MKTIAIRTRAAIPFSAPGIGLRRRRFGRGGFDAGGGFGGVVVGVPRSPMAASAGEGSEAGTSALIGRSALTARTLHAGPGCPTSKVRIDWLTDQSIGQRRGRNQWISH
jgi:hypothetical protein